MKIKNSTKGLVALLLMGGFMAYFVACNSSTTSPAQNDNDYITSVVTGGTGAGDESDLTSREVTDYDDGGAVSDGGGSNNPIDSLSRWGRKVTGVTIDAPIQSVGDSLKIVNITRTITGIYIIIGWSGGNPDSVTKPYTEVFHRVAIFRRVATTQYPRLNWKLYKYTLLDGATQTPQPGKSQISINSITATIPGSIVYAFQGTDFTNDTITTMYAPWNGSGMPNVHQGDQVTVDVYLTSNQPVGTDYVAWHWARNTFGFHRVPFTYMGQVNGQSHYQRTFNIYSNHILGTFNAYISANTHQSLWDDNTQLFSSTEVGIPYRVKAQ